MRPETDTDTYLHDASQFDFLTVKTRQGMAGMSFDDNIFQVPCNGKIGNVHTFAR